MRTAFVAFALVTLVGGHSAVADDFSSLSKGQILDGIKSRLDFSIYYPVATAQSEALRCKKPQVAAELEARLMVAASQIVTTIDLVRRKLEAEQMMCCKDIMTRTWNAGPCDPAKETERRERANRQLSELQGLVDAYHAR